GAVGVASSYTRGRSVTRRRAGRRRTLGLVGVWRPVGFRLARWHPIGRPSGRGVPPAVGEAGSRLRRRSPAGNLRLHLARQAQEVSRGPTVADHAFDELDSLLGWDAKRRQGGGDPQHERRIVSGPGGTYQTAHVA